MVSKITSIIMMSMFVCGVAVADADDWYQAPMYQPAPRYVPIVKEEYIMTPRGMVEEEEIVYVPQGVVQYQSAQPRYYPSQDYYPPQYGYQQPQSRFEFYIDR